jgi:hypothetical protein
MNQKRIIIIGGVAGGASAAIPPHTQAPIHVRGGSGARGAETNTWRKSKSAPT